MESARFGNPATGSELAASEPDRAPGIAPSPPQDTNSPSSAAPCGTRSSVETCTPISTSRRTLCPTDILEIVKLRSGRGPLGHRARLRNNRRARIGRAAGRDHHLPRRIRTTARHASRSVEFGDSDRGRSGARRDFSVNAMALRLPAEECSSTRPVAWKTCWPAGWRHRRSRPRSPSETTPCRMMRAARFTSPAGIHTRRRRPSVAMTELADRGSRSSVDRAGERRALQAAVDGVRRGPGIQLLVDTGLAAIVLPEVPALRLEIDEHAHHKDVYEHSLTVLDQAIDLREGAGSGRGARPHPAPRRTAARHRQTVDQAGRARGCRGHLSPP